MKKLKLYSVFQLLLSVLFAFNANSLYSQASISNYDITFYAGSSAPMSVAWNPTKLLYYVSSGGGTGSPVYTFNSSGTGGVSSSHNVDNRGLWYNTTNGRLEGSAYSAGYMYYPLDANGAPSGNAVFTVSSGGVPNAQSGGVRNAANGEILFYAGGGSFYRYNSSGTQLGTVNITVPSGASFNTTHMIYTGMTGKEVGFFDSNNRRVYLYSIAGGSYSYYYNLPASAPNPANYGFAFANNRFFIGSAGTWYGYLIPSNIYEVMGAGTPNANGTYIEAGTNDGVSYYEKTGSPTMYLYRYDDFYSGKVWAIGSVLNSSDVANQAYYKLSAAATPGAITFSNANYPSGATPTPVVSVANPVHYVVSGAGTTNANGIYTEAGTNDNVSYFIKTGSPTMYLQRYYDFYNGSTWAIASSLNNSDPAYFKLFSSPATPSGITFTYNNGTTGVNPNPVVSTANPIVTISPASATAGSTVTLTGYYFNGVSAVTIGGVAVSSYTVVNSNTITAVVASGNTGTVSVTTAAATMTSVGTFTLSVPPTITSFTPTSGTSGTTVTITGTNFTGATAVSFGGTAATSFSVVSATSITAVVAAGTTGTISVTTPYGTATSASTFTALNIYEVMGAGTANANGTYIQSASLNDGVSYYVKTGSPTMYLYRYDDFYSGKVWAIGSVLNSSDVANQAYYKLSAAATPGAITFSNANYPSGATPTPVVSVANPVHYVVSGAGTTNANGIYTEAGTNDNVSYFIKTGSPTMYLQRYYDFYNGSTWAIASSLNNSDPAYFKLFSSPATPSGITFTYNNGTTGVNPNPVVSTANPIVTISPASATAGSTVTLTGYYFNGVSAVTIGGVAVSSYTVVNSNTITAVVASGNTGTVSVTTAAATMTSVGTFTLSVPPTITSFTPTSGTSGTTVTITGTNFTGATAVSFGGTAATLFSVVSATSITAVVAAGTTGTISVTTPYGTAASAGTFTYNIPAPSALSYTTPNVFTKGSAITALNPTVTGTVVSYSVSPALPAGLSLNTTTGVISGTPSAITAIADYTITATNTGGNTTKVISITVNDVAPSALSYTTPNVFTKGSAITALNPTVTGAVVSYSVSPALPAGLSLNSTTGVITGTPSAITAIADYTITATNTGGNTTKVISITVNDVAPSALSYTTPNVFTKGSAITALNPTVTGTVVSYSVSPTLPAGLSLNTTTGVISGTPSAITAIADYTITATNTGGNTTKVISITVNDVAPSALSYTTPNVFTKGSAITALNPTVTGTVVSYSVSPALPAGLSLNTTTGVISGTPSAITAIADYTITATNTGGNTTKVISITVNDVAPSALSYTTPNVFTKGSAITALNPTVTGAVVSYSVSPALPAGLSLNTTTGVITGTPSAITAIADYTITATNTGGNTTKVISITVNDVAPSALSYTTPNVFTKGSAITALNPTVTGAVVSYSVSPALPAGLSLNTTTGVISGTPSAITAIADYTIMATNTGGNTTKVISITVNDVAPSELSYGAPITATYGIAITNITPTVTGTVVSYSVSPALPAGLSLNSTTGVISGTAITTQSQTSYTLTAANTGGTTSAILKITVYAKGVNISGVTVANKTYDGTTTAILSGGTLSGIIGSDVVTILAGTGTFADKNVGQTKTVTISGYSLGGANAANYVLLSQPASLTADINTASLSVTATNKTKIYGEANPAFTLNYSGFVNGEDASVITLPSISCNATALSNAGDYTITLNGGSATNYSLSLINGTLSVAKATLTVTATDASKYPGSSNPDFGFTYSGFVNTDTQVDIDTKPIVSCVATSSSPEGDYDIIVSGGSDNNYDFVYVKAVLTISVATEENKLSATDYSFYPNPAIDYIQIKTPDNKMSVVTIFDLTGHMVLQSVVKNDKIDIQHLTNGVYTLRINNCNFKLIKK